MVDVFWRSPGAGVPSPTLTYRLVDAEAGALLCLRPSENAVLLPGDGGAGLPGDGGDLVILRLAELRQGLPALLPQRDQRNAFIAALRESLQDWPAQGQASAAARLRAACSEAIARLPEPAARPPNRRHPAQPPSALKADEESQEALFRALYFCQRRADGNA